MHRDRRNLARSAHSVRHSYSLRADHAYLHSEAVLYGLRDTASLFSPPWDIPLARTISVARASRLTFGWLLDGTNFPRFIRSRNQRQLYYTEYPSAFFYPLI